MNLSIFNQFHKPFYAQNHYRQNAAAGNGVGFSLLFVLALILVGGFVATIAKPLNHFFTTDLQATIAQSPVIKIHDGKIAIDKPYPYDVVLPFNAGKIAFRKKPLRDIEDLKSWMDENGAVALVTETNIAVIQGQRRDGEVRIWGIKSADDFTLTRQMLNDVAVQIQRWSWPFIIIASILSVWLYKIIQALCLSLIGMIVDSAMNTRLSYAVILRFSSDAIWVASLICLALQLMHVATAWFLFPVMAIGCLIFAHWSVKNSPARQLL